MPTNTMLKKKVLVCSFALVAYIVCRLAFSILENVPKLKKFEKLWANTQ